MKKKILTTIFIALLVMMNFAIVHAEDNNTVNLKITSNKTTVKKGEEIEVTITGENIKSNDIMVIGGILDYDKNMLELVKSDEEENVAKTEQNENWVSSVVSIESSNLSAITTKPVDGEVIKLKFKVLKSTGNTEIKLKESIAKDKKSQDVNTNCESIKIKGSANYILIIVGIVIILLLVIFIFVIRKKKSK